MSAKTTTFTNNVDGDLDTVGNWDLGVPVSGDTAIISGVVDSGTMPAGVIVNVNVEDGVVVVGGTWNSQVVVGAPSGQTAVLVDGLFNQGIKFNSSTVYSVNQLAVGSQIQKGVTNGPYTGTLESSTSERNRPQGVI